MIRVETLPLTLLLLACSPAPVAPRPAHSDTAEPTPALPFGEKVPDGAAIRGEWRLAGVAGASVEQPEAITISILSDEIHAVAGCLRWNWNYRLAGGSLTTKRRPSASPPCARPLTPLERSFEAAMGRALFAVRRSDGSMVLAGENGELVLFTQ